MFETEFSDPFLNITAQLKFDFGGWRDSILCGQLYFFFLPTGCVCVTVLRLSRLLLPVNERPAVDMVGVSSWCVANVGMLDGVIVLSVGDVSVT